MINFDTLGAARLNADPYPWARYSGAFSDPKRLADTFPDDNYEQHAQRRLLETLGRGGSAEWYQHNVVTRALLELGETRPFKPEGLDDAWHAVAEDLVSPEYRERLTDVTGYDVRSIPMQAHFWIYREGSFFKPHVDKPHKVVTHLMYLTDGWQPEMGGSFQVLGSGDQEDVREEISPSLNNAIVLRRTDNAWHSVSEVPRGQPPRILLQSWFWAQ